MPIHDHSQAQGKRIIAEFFGHTLIGLLVPGVHEHSVTVVFDCGWGISMERGRREHDDNQFKVATPADIEIAVKAQSSELVAERDDIKDILALFP